MSFKEYAKMGTFWSVVVGIVIFAFLVGTIAGKELWRKHEARERRFEACEQKGVDCGRLMATKRFALEPGEQILRWACCEETEE